jgi:hypothetical protein
MTKRTTFTAIDPNGVEHVRTSDRRNYSHTVVAQYNKADHMNRAVDPNWAKTDGSNWDYHAKIANGNDPYPSKCYLGNHPDKYSAEQIAEEVVTVAATNAKRVEDAKTFVSITREEHIAKMLADRIAAVEAKDYNGWHNLGWCGRRDLADKLASGKDGNGGGYYHNATVLEAVIK